MRSLHVVSIARPPVVIFDHIADGSRNATWRPSVVEVSLHSGDLGAGTVWKQVIHGPGGRLADADYRVTRYEPHTAYGYEIIAGPIRGSALFTLTAAEDSETAVTAEMILKPRGAMRLLTGFVLRRLVDEMDSLDRLREVLNAAHHGTN
ncbi:MAG: SRPBCC family protein [Candidatus Dormibacteraeota bacterium]|uniref:SRPBCC family protein n=1 Tax=Candidatus Aeolococcus gillhamiae TaxID=3127015 RepID=A0A934NAF0_9BACT|nr:SRPBCC family protein [Candidatus Dormibacteraeota bacterium]